MITPGGSVVDDWDFPGLGNGGTTSIASVDEGGDARIFRFGNNRTAVGD